MPRQPTPKMELLAHLNEMHDDHGTDGYWRSTYVELQGWHRYEHVQCRPNHHHIGQGLDPVTQPQGWNDGGCRHTVVRHPTVSLPPDQVPYTVPDSRGNRVRVEGVDRCYCGCKYWENDQCIDCGGTEVEPAT